jgi:dsRNA-specific ribonuclease
MEYPEVRLRRRSDGVYTAEVYVGGKLYGVTQDRSSYIAERKGEMIAREWVQNNYPNGRR